MEDYFCCKIMKNKSNLTYSYDNTKTILTKNAVSNTASIKVYHPNCFNDCIVNIIDIRKAKISKCYIDKIDIYSDIYIKEYCISNYNGTRRLFVDFQLNFYITNKEGDNCYCRYCKGYQYLIPIHKCKVDNLCMNIKDMDFYILPNGDIKVNTCIQFKF